MVMGRPKKPTNERRNTKIDFRASEDTLRKLDECKEVLNCNNRSEVIIKAIDELHAGITENK